MSVLEQEKRQNDPLKVSLSPLCLEFQNGQLFIKKEVFKNVRVSFP